jgi:hypothetical protein
VRWSDCENAPLVVTCGHSSFFSSRAGFFTVLSLACVSDETEVLIEDAFWGGFASFFVPFYFFSFTNPPVACR